MTIWEKNFYAIQYWRGGNTVPNTGIYMMISKECEINVECVNNTDEL